MKLTRIGQVLLAATVCLGLGFSMTSCSPNDTIDYLFVTSNTTSSGGSNGQITSYHVDDISGSLSEVAGSPFSSGGVNPVAEVPSPNGQVLYVANHDSSNIAEFVIGTNGQLSSPANTYTTPGTDPVALAINTSGTLLFVVDYFAPGYSAATPGPGALVVYPINTDGSLGSPVVNGGASYSPLQCYPGGVAVTANGKFAYVTNTNSVVVTTSSPTAGALPGTPPGCPTQGTVSGFSVASTGALTPVAGSPFLAGASPTGIAIDPTSRFVYVTDSTQNQLIAYDILAAGQLNPVINGPFGTGIFPVGVVVDPRGEYIYVTNFNDGTISEYSIAQANGAPSASAAGVFNLDSKGPTCLVVDPAFGRFVYASTYVGDYVGAAQLAPDTGALSGIQNAPYGPISGRPTCVAAVPHGNHANQITTDLPGD